MIERPGESEATYQKLLPDLQPWVGWFALVRGSQLGGIFSTHDTAARAWMAMYGPVPALIRRIERLRDAIPTVVAAPTAVRATAQSPAEGGRATRAEIAEAERPMAVSSSRAFGREPTTETNGVAA